MHACVCGHCVSPIRDHIRLWIHGFEGIVSALVFWLHLFALFNRRLLQMLALKQERHRQTHTHRHLEIMARMHTQVQTRTIIRTQPQQQRTDSETHKRTQTKTNTSSIVIVVLVLLNTSRLILYGQTHRPAVIDSSDQSKEPAPA